MTLRIKNTILKILVFLIFIPLLLAPGSLRTIYCLEGKELKRPFIMPIDGEVLTSFRQEYYDEEESVTRRHTGIDILGEPGQYVQASGNAVVSYIGFSPIGGRTLVLRHNEKIRTTYLNLENIYVVKGQSVSQGEVIAAIGANDDPSSEHIHLHFAVIFEDTYLDPIDLIEIDYSSISRFIELEYIKDDFSIIMD